MPMIGVLRRVLRALNVFAAACVLVACDSSTSGTASSTPQPGSYVVSGAAINGPLAFADVSVYAPDGRLLGQSTTGPDGRYQLTVDLPPPYRVTVQGGMLDETPYTAVLRGECESGEDCNVTPFTTAVAQLIDEHGFNVGDARALLANSLSIEEDPFVSALLDGEPQAGFDLDGVRDFIDGGEHLDAWVAGIVEWVSDSSADHEPPPGVITTVAVTANASSGGSIDPTTRVVRYGERAQFVVTPEITHQVASVTGCGGSLSGNVYTTEPVASACTVQADFSPKGHVVTAIAGEGGTIEPGSSSVPHGSTLTLNVRPQDGFRIREVAGCGGELNGNVFTTAPITSSCTVNALFNRMSHVASAIAGPGGSIVPGTREVLHGERASFQLIAQDGYQIAGATGCGGTLNGSIYTTAPMSETCTVTASFSLRNHPVTAHASDGGRIGPTSANVMHGERASFSVTPDVGYRIENVAGCGGQLAGNTYGTGPITGACSVNATFSRMQHTVAVDAGEGGAVSPSSRTVAHGDQTSFTLTPDVGYRIERATGCDGALSGTVFTTGPITRSCAVTVSFAANSYPVTATATNGGQIDPASTTVRHGQNASFTLTPEAGYSIDSVTGCAGSLSGDVYTTDRITAACTVAASFALNRYPVTATTSAGGSINPASATVAHGERASFTLTPDAGYGIDTVTGCAGTLDGNVFSTAAITEACSIVASFSLLRYTVTASAGEGGSIAPGSAQLEHGHSASFVVSANAGYDIETVQGCGGALDGDIYTTAPVTTDCAVTASFVRRTYVLSAKAGEGGSITPASSNVVHGESAQLTISPDDGYRIDTVSGCGGNLAGETYTTGAITANCTVNATFARRTYMVTTHAGAGGSIAPNSAEVEHGKQVTFNVIADAGHRIAKVSGCAGNLADGTYTTGAITADCSLTATFERSLTAPGNFAAEPGDRRITLRWDPVEGAEDYDVYHAREAFDPENYSVYEGGTLTPGVASAPHAVTDLMSNTEYFFSVRARAGATRGPLSALLSAKTFPMCFGLSSDSPGVCSGNGTCVAQDTCKCDGIYSGRRCDQEMIFDYGSDEYTWPTRIPIYLPILGKELDPTDTYVWAYEVLANGWFDMNPGFSFGLSSYPPPSGTHQVGDYSDQWAYRGLEGHIATANTLTPFGRPVGEIGDRILLKYDGPANTLSFYTKLAGEDTWTLEGGGVAFTNVVLPENKVLRQVVTIACIAECAIRMIPPGPDVP